MTEHTPQQPDVPGEPFLSTSPTTTVPSPPDIDGALAERLQKLAAARAQTGKGTVPPTARTNVSSTKRRHPAKHSRTAALALSVLASGGLGLFFATGESGVSAFPAETPGLVTAAPAATATATAATTPSSTTAPATTAPATVNGDSYSNKYGNVQVQATFATDGTLTNVSALEVPYRDGESVDINSWAVPRLNSAALTAQSANVNTVSGATYTSNDYKQSLQSAIDVAVSYGIPAGAGA